MSVLEMADVERLDVETVFVMPVTRDWSHSHDPRTGEPLWRALQAPACELCGVIARWRTGEALASAPEPETFAEHEELQERIEAAGLATDDEEAWRCVNVACEQYGREVDDSTEGPMMNYSYPLPNERAGGRRGYDEHDADRLADLPLCIVTWEDGERDADLALTGGGMDLSFDICEAFARLGLCPPLHFCPPEASGEPRERVRVVAAACQRTVTYATRRVARIAADVDELQGLERFPEATPANMRRCVQEGIAGVVVWDPETGETFSATPGDYFMLGDDAPTTSADGRPLRLVVSDRSETRRLVAPFAPGSDA